MWNMRRRHSSHSCQPAAAEPSVKGAHSPARSSKRSGDPLRTAERRLYARERAGCWFRPLSLCFQQVPRAEAAGYSRSNRKQPLLPSTTVFSKSSRRRNLREPCSTRAGVTCRHSCRCRRQRRSWNAGPDTEFRPRCPRGASPRTHAGAKM